MGEKTYFDLMILTKKKIFFQHQSKTLSSTAEKRKRKEEDMHVHLHFDGSAPEEFHLHLHFNDTHNTTQDMVIDVPHTSGDADIKMSDVCVQQGTVFPTGETHSTHPALSSVPTPITCDSDEQVFGFYSV